MMFLAIFLSLVCWIDLIWHIVLVLNVFQHLPTLPCHDISFKNDTGHDIMQKSQECVFEWSKVPCERLLTIFCNLFCWIDLLLNFWIVCHLAIWPCCHVFVQVGQFDMLKMLTWRWAGHSKWRYSSQRQLRSGFLLLVRWSVSLLFFRKTAHRIFPIFCMNVPYYKGKKRTRRFSREKSGSFKNSRC